MNRREFFAGGLMGTGLLIRPRVGRSQTTTEHIGPNGDTSAYPLTNGRDLAVVNADIITLDPGRPSASAALVRNGRVVMVDDTRSVRSQAGKAPEYDAGGRVVIPGFVENHCHVEDSCVVGDEQPTLRGIRSISEMVARVRSMAALTPKGEWVLMQAVAADFPSNVVEKRWLNRQDLDEGRPKSTQ